MECISSEAFLLLVRSTAGASQTLESQPSFLEDLVYRNHLVITRLHLQISEKIENKPRFITVSSEDVAYSKREVVAGLSQPASRVTSMKLRIAEIRDNMITDQVVPVGGGEQPWSD